MINNNLYSESIYNNKFYLSSYFKMNDSGFNFFLVEYELNTFEKLIKIRNNLVENNPTEKEIYYLNK